MRPLLFALAALLWPLPTQSEPGLVFWSECNASAQLLAQAQAEHRLYPINDPEAVVHLSRVYRYVTGNQDPHEFAMFWPRGGRRIAFFLGRNSHVCEGFEGPEEAYDRLVRLLPGMV